MKNIKIAIDGPAASGKSTTARILAQRLKYLYIDTGAMYRALTFAVLQAGISVNNKSEIIELARSSSIELKQNSFGVKTFLNGEDVSKDIRLPKINEIISEISAVAAVREIMVSKQRSLAADGGVVMDGRDIGSVVLPDAELKVYMKASVEERARRRYNELIQNSAHVKFEDVRKDIEKRDHIDSTRNASPLKATADAFVIDTTGISVEEQVDIIYKKVKSILKL